MYRIVPAIGSLEQHLRTLTENPQAYRPTRCVHCGLGNLWCHGHYERKADRRGGALNPIPIPRFLCPGCGRSCSRLPSCIAPRRWYDWAMQQAVLVGLLVGLSLNACAAMYAPARRTMARWWGWLRERSGEFEFHLRSHWPEWGGAAHWQDFWGLALGSGRLRELMAWLDGQGITVP